MNKFNASVVVALLVLATVYAVAFRKTPRDRAIDAAVKHVFGVKKAHHDRIVNALRDGATEDEHIALLEEKRKDVLEAAVEAENAHGIVIDKSEPTTPGPITVIKR